MTLSIMPCPEIQISNIPMIKEDTIDATPLPEILAAYDKGGGVTTGDRFIIFTITSLPESWQSSPGASGNGAARLDSLAKAVARTIPIYIRSDQLDVHNLKSLPSPPRATRPVDEVDRKPWFFINASTSKYHGVGGKNSEAETLLCVLRRPWCVMELCCCSVETLELLRAFAKVAFEYDPKSYESAVALLSHELEKRATGKGLPTSLEAAARRNIPLRELKQISSAIFLISILSFNGFWLRLICACALYLGVPYSRLGPFLGDPASLLPPTPASSWMKARRAITSGALLDVGPKKDAKRVLKPSRSSQHLAKPPKVIQRTSIIRRTTWTAKSTEQQGKRMDSKALMITVYAHILRELMHGLETLKSH